MVKFCFSSSLVERRWLWGAGVSITLLGVLAAGACSSGDVEFSPTGPAQAGLAGEPALSGGGSTSAMGGAPSGGSEVVQAGGNHPGSGASGEGGISGEGGSATAGQSGQSQSGGGAPAGGAGGNAGSGGENGGEGSCLTGWQGSSCDICSGETQSDRAKCKALLECYEKHSCGPQSCADDGQACGTAAIGAGAAPYPIAAAVYDCRCD